MASAPLYREVGGFVTVGLRGGVRMGRHEFLVDVENLTDKNYRGASWVSMRQAGVCHCDSLRASEGGRMPQA